MLARFIAEDGAQDLVEYALLAAFIGIAGWAVLMTLPNVMGATYASWMDPRSACRRSGIRRSRPPVRSQRTRQRLSSLETLVMTLENIRIGAVLVVAIVAVGVRCAHATDSESADLRRRDIWRCCVAILSGGLPGS